MRGEITQEDSVEDLSMAFSRLFLGFVGDDNLSYELVVSTLPTEGYFQIWRKPGQQVMRNRS